MPSFIPNTLPCKFFLAGRCSAGDTCPFAHLGTRPVCTYYLAGNCKHGSTCVMLHESCANIISTSLGLEPRYEDFNESHKDVIVEDGIFRDLLNLTVSSDSDEDQMDFGMEVRRIIEQRKENAHPAQSPFTSTNPSDFVRSTRPPATGPYSHLPFSAILSQSTPIITTQSPKMNSPFVTSQIIQANVSSEENRELCAFAVIGRCKFGSICRNLHGLQCPRCLRYCLHPSDLDQNEDHLNTCMHKPVRECPEVAEEIECGICLEKVLSKPDPRFGILACSHPFCLSCIRSWRAKDREPSFHSSSSETPNPRDLVRSCPICRCITHFIIPSSVWISHPDEKEHLVSLYKRKLSQIPCKYFDYGRSICPFGSSCFYEHSLPDGTPFTGQLPIIRNAVDKEERQRCLKERNLADFVERAIRDKIEADERALLRKQQR